MGSCPAIIPYSPLHPGITYWLVIITGMGWETLVSLVILYRELGTLRWSTIRQRIWLQTPLDPKTGQPNPRLLWWALQNLSWMAVKLGRYDEAREALEESVLLNTSISDRWNPGFAYCGLGLIAQAQGDHLQAVDMFRKSLDTLVEVGARQDEARVLVEMSHSIFALGNDAEAKRSWREALHVTMETQGTFVALEALVGMAMLKMKHSQMEQALELLWIVLNHPASLPETKDRANRLREKLNVQFSPTQVEAIPAQAGKKTFAMVVEELLK